MEVQSIVVEVVADATCGGKRGVYKNENSRTTKLRFQSNVYYGGRLIPLITKKKRPSLLHNNKWTASSENKATTVDRNDKATTVDCNDNATTVYRNDKATTVDRNDKATTMDCIQWRNVHFQVVGQGF
ncbi:hypothetical protein TNCV_2375871 [Trichonephila clavipes]|nr:hypothetical protein TNCV_2375871 [Trichonephila clavipes]